MKKLKLFFALFAMLALGVGNAWAEEVTYVFTSKDWAAKIGSTAADWTSNKAGAGFSNNGIQVTTAATGANGTSPISYNNISQIVVTYNTNTSKGKGTLSVKIGDNAVTTNNWQYSGSANGTSANFTSTFDYSSPQSGKVTLTANTTTNSIYVVSIKIITSAAGGETPGEGGGEEPEEPETPVDPGTGTSTNWVETVISDITASDMVVVTMTNASGTYAMSNNNGTSKAPTATKVEVKDGKLTQEPANEYKWNISNTSGTLTFYPNGSTATWLYCTATNNGVRVGTNTASTFTIDAESGYLKHTGTTRYLGVYNSADWRCYTTSTTTNIANQTLKFYKYLDPNAATKPSAPRLPSSQEFETETFTVEISADAGTTIYYTLNGDEPTAASNQYTAPFTISATTTVKAIAIKGEYSSSVTEATYTILAPLSTMDEIFAKATEVGTTATSVKVAMNNWVVTGVKSSNAYVTDGTKGLIIYNASHGFVVGDVLSGTVACKVQLYNGSAELTSLTKTTEGLTVTTGGAVTPVVVNDVTTLSGVNTGSVIKITGICESGNVVAGAKLYGTLYTFDNLTVGNKYNVTGVYLQYGDVEEILPRKQEDIEEVQDLATATISVSNISLEVDETKTIEATITPDAAKTKVQYAITAGSEYVTLNGATITGVAAGEATITATIAEVAGEYYGATKTFTVTIKPQNIAELPFTFNGRKADIENTLGMSQKNLGSDYTSEDSPKLKFDDTDDNVIIHFDSEPGEFSFVLKQNGQTAGTFTVYESANGEDYTPVWTGGDLGNAKSETITPTLAAASRYVKFEYTTKPSGTNYGLGSISIQKPDFRQEASLTWSVGSVTLNQGDNANVPTLSNPNGLTLTSCTTTNDAVATVSPKGVITLVGAIGTTTITATFEGNEDYKPAEVSCTITVVKEQIPTGTFALYTGEIVEGDYVIVYDNFAMNTTSSAAPRLQYQEVTPAENKLVNPANQIVWHVAANGEYWTLYNDYDEVYAVSTGVKNQATTAKEVTDKAKWSISGTETYDMANLDRENGSDPDNKYLRKNSDVGFACYKDATGGQLTLYRKQTPHIVTVAACTNGSVSASGVVDTKALSGDIITLSNTPEFDYQFVGYNVYKTGDETTVITVTNGTFTMPAFDVTISATFEAIQETTITLSGKFSTGEYEYAEFATGNLQHNPKSGDWRFAKQQYQYVGKDNIYVGKEDYEGWIDLFGWSADDKFGVNPSNDNTNYQGEFVDWGTLFPEEGWSTLSKNQWYYLLNQRTKAASLKQIAMVGETLGIMLFPDEWTLPDDCEPTQQTHHDEEDGEDHSCDFVSYNYTLAQWTELEKAGAIFLPAAGRRTGGWGNETISPHMIGKAELDADNHYKHYADYYAYYWTSTKTDGKVNYLINCTLVDKVKDTYTVHAGHVNWAEEARYGQSVRLAKVTVTPEVIRDGLTVGQWGTLCPKQNVDNPTGATFYQIAYLEEKDRLPFNMHFYEVEGNLEAGQPYFFIASATEIKGVKSGDEKNEGSNKNGFYGYIGAEAWTLPYQESFDATSNKNTFVIWDNSVFRINAETKIKSERCYININSSEPSRISTLAPVGARRITMGVSGINGQNTATGMENVDASAQPVKTIINGQLFILRGEKMYDAQGKLVK